MQRGLYRPECSSGCLNDSVKALDQKEFKNTFVMNYSTKNIEHIRFSRVKT